MPRPSSCAGGPSGEQAGRVSWGGPEQSERADRAAPGPIDRTFTEVLVQSPAKGGWTYVVTDWSAGWFGTRGRVKVAATADGIPFVGTFMALGDGTHKLALTADLR